ncbi:hypothetical protein [Lactococcus protaetiae]|nr:hypothetical protein [Lactococcus protaetiae]
MKKLLLTILTTIAVFSLISCTKNSNHSEEKNSASAQSSQQKSSSQTKTKVPESTNQQNETTSSGLTLFAGYSTSQIEYARVTETLLAYYHQSFQPVSITVIKNGSNHAVFSYPGSITQPETTVTLSYSSDGTMAGTTIVTYSSNHDGSINFYKNPNHYQDPRYLNDAAWVKSESKKLLATTQTLEIPTTFDEKAAQIISKITIE